MTKDEAEKLKDSAQTNEQCMQEQESDYGESRKNREVASRDKAEKGRQSRGRRVGVLK